MRVLTAEEMRRAEKLAVEAGSSYEALMEQAGQGAASLLLSRERARLEKEGLTVLLGRGNNGGDGLVIARAVLEALPGARVRLIFCLGEALSELAALNLARLERFGGRVERYTAEEAPETAFSGVILDGIFGTGFHGGLPDGIRPVLRAANRSDTVRIALDIPTGINGDNGLSDPDAFRAEGTYAFAALKPAHLFKSSRGLCGETEVVPIGITGEMLAAAGGLIRMDKALVRDYLPPRTADSHKGSYGKLMGIGGSGTMTGAVLLSMSGAARCGVGLVMAAAPEIAMQPVRMMLPEALQYPFPLGEDGLVAADALPALLRKAADWPDAVLCGCGLGLGETGEGLVKGLLALGKPLVLDADGLGNLAKMGAGLLREAGGPVVLTPHMAEFSRLCGRPILEIRENRIDFARQFAREYRVTLVLKDSTTLVASPGGTVYINDNGNSGLSRGGSGDTLAGMIASFLAQGAKPEEAAVCGVYLHALAGDLAAAELTAYGMTITDVIRHIPGAFREVLGET